MTIHGPRYRMLVIGAGQLSRYLCHIAVGLDYQVPVCDPHKKYTDEWDASGTKIVRTMRNDTVLCIKLDDLALVEALKPLRSTWTRWAPGVTTPRGVSGSRSSA